MPAVVYFVAAAAAAALYALAGGTRAGSRTVAKLSDDRAVNVVFDGKLWRPMGTEDFAIVALWSATGAKMADINGSPKTWNGVGFE